MNNGLRILELYCQGFGPLSELAEIYGWSYYKFMRWQSKHSDIAQRFQEARQLDSDDRWQ
jgi:hypothetical protein